MIVSVVMAGFIHKDAEPKSSMDSMKISVEQVMDTYVRT
jgi:hypothetical protein